jgi:hypothetical protein
MDEIAATQRIEQEWVKRSAGKWTGSITDIREHGGSAAIPKAAARAATPG